MTLIEKVAYRLETVSRVENITRLIEVIPTNRYVIDEFRSRHDVELVTNPNQDVPSFFKSLKTVNHLTDLMYIEIPDNFTFKQHEELSRYLRQIPCGWVTHSRLVSYLGDYYSYFRNHDNIYSNDVYKPKHIGLHQHPSGYLCIPLNKTEYLICDRAAHNTIYTGSIHTKAAKYSFMGEMAFAKFGNLTVDMIQNTTSTERPDFVFHDGQMIKVRTFANYESGKILSRAYSSEQHKDSGDEPFPIKYDLYIGCHIINEGEGGNAAIVALDGFATKGDMLTKSTLESGYTERLRRGHWYNRELSFRDLRPITELIVE